MHAFAVALSAFALPGFSVVAQEPAGGQLLAGSFPGLERPGYVYLPPDFRSTQRYPVVYLLHGMPGSPSEYVNGTDLGSFADSRIVGGELRPFIAVIPAAGADARYDGEWAGRWERALVDRVVPWVDAHLPTIGAPSGRVIAGLSAGGFGAVDIALHRPELFGAAESWSGYFRPLDDDPFKGASKATLAANNPMQLVRRDAAALRHAHLRVFLSTGPYHSHLFAPAETDSFARELRSLRLPVTLVHHPSPKGQWRAQLDAGLLWALAP